MMEVDMWFGFGLVIVGILLLLNNLGIIQGDSWGYIWPSLIILLGLAILFRRNEKRCCEPKHEQREEKKEEAKKESE